jgi:hypothetical protein
MRVLLFLVLFSFSLHGFSQSKIYMIGKVANANTKAGIQKARIFNKNAKAGSVTNDKGLFFIWAIPGDSVYISAKGYKQMGFVCRQTTKDTTFYLGDDPTNITELEEVIVTGKKTEQMKREIKELLQEGSNAGKFDTGSLLSTNTSPGSAGAGLSLGAVYDYFSKQGKDRRKAEMLTQQDKLQFYADWKLNEKLVKRLTAAEGKELEDYMHYLKIRLTQDYILRASDYELNATIIKFYETFAKIRSY